MSPGTPLRQEIEDRYYATPLYERDALAQREAARSSGLARMLWLSFTPRWRGQTPIKGKPQGVHPANDDREVLRARLLADYRHLYPSEYRGLLRSLVTVTGEERDYRLLRAESFVNRLIGGDFSKVLPLAKAAEALRPDDPTTWWTMQDTYFSLIVHGVGNGRENWKAYLRYVARCRELARASNTTASREDVRTLDLDRKWLAKVVEQLYRPDGTLIKKP